MAYKIISKSRYGSNVLYCSTNNPEIQTRLVENFLQRNPEMIPFYPKYEKNKWVHAVKGSTGICCFKSKKYAEEFIKCEIPYRVHRIAMIIKVSGKKEIKDPILMTGCGGLKKDLLKYNHYKYKYGSYRRRSIPEGAIFFEKVKVLE